MHAFTIALAGNPNSGKTSLFNLLTGSNYKVANYPGVTVEKRAGVLPLGHDARAALIDLPGIYSLGGASLDEMIATQALLGDLNGEALPDLVVAVLDAANLERNLYFATQLIDLNIPVVLALNMVDLAEKKGLRVKSEILSRLLDVPVICVVARKGLGVDQLKAAIESALRSRHCSAKSLAWAKGQESYLKAALQLGLAELGESADRTRAIAIGAAMLSDSYHGQKPHMNIRVAKAISELKSELADPSSFEPAQRYQFIQTLLKQCCVQGPSEESAWVERIARLSTHRVWGTLIFALIMAFIFQSIFMWASVPMDLIDSAVTWSANQIGALMPEGILRSLLVDGVIAGVGSVLVFIPQIALLFFFLALLEDSGYLARAAFLMDGMMRRFGLQGRSFIPLLSSFACAIPGIMSTRTIPSLGDRLATILVAPWMSCSARLPVYAVLIAAFIPQLYLFGFLSLQGLVLLSMYILGVVGAVLVALLLRKTILRGEAAIFVMEMPTLRLPSLKLALQSAWERVKIFVSSAGTIILACTVVLWFLASFPGDKIEQSFAGQFGHAIEPLIKPLGFDWQVGVGILASFAAREVFVSSLATVYNLESDDSTAESLTAILRHKHLGGEFSLASALALMVFYVFACQCISTLAICRRETGSWWWTGFMFSYMTVFAYLAAWVTFRLFS